MEIDRTLRRLGFSVLYCIGEGAFGKVILATSKRYPNPVAIKIMDRRIMNILFNPGYMDFIYKHMPRELAIVKRVKHPHIVEVHDILKRSGWAFIVMEPAAMDLYKKIKQIHHIPMGQAKEWFSQLLSAVIYLHQQDIVHRDLKCENVLLTADGQVKLTDFGLGCFSRGFPELCLERCGTYHYLAPERLMNKPYDAKKSDVWSLGVILYIMVTGILPFNRDNWTNIPRYQPGVVKFPEGIPVEESCRDIISSMLEFDPCDRPSAVAVAQHPWLNMRQERVIGRFVVVTVDEDGGSSDPGTSVNPVQEGGSSRAGGTSVTCPRVEAVEEKEKEEKEEKEDSIGCCLFCAAKRAARANIIAPILRASRTIRERMRKMLKRTSSSSSQKGARHSAASAEVPAHMGSEHLQEDGTPDVPTAAKDKRKWLRFPQFKILKKRFQPL